NLGRSPERPAPERVAGTAGPRPGPGTGLADPGGRASLASPGPQAELVDGTGDRIELRGLRFLGCHGALPWEAGAAQPFEVDLDILADLSQAGLSDELGATVDYGRLCEAVRSVIEGPHVQLLEHLAEQVAERALSVAGARARGAVVVVRKLRPPVPFQLRSAGVRICRWRSGPGSPAGGSRAR
ncbi:MAG: dihydroneopterin aldolase, partial [Acidimicrobiales bacterium]